MTTLESAIEAMQRASQGSAAIYRQHIETLIAAARAGSIFEDKATQLQAFKTFVHATLDDAGVDKHEELNATSGCRIGGRLKDLIAVAPTGGAKLIATERQEQIHKHGWNSAHDADYGKGELVQAAATCLSLYVKGEMASINVAGEINERKMWPWQSEFGMTYYAKIWAKSDIDKLKVAGALIAAEIDRLQSLPDPTTA